ncbi:hypothetical protein I2I05_12905 [Hymenobacter sp. BT683]|uniref:Uncharacterized protein n=1 Tax=Hymenobacter jeongseonensis TaxID=2791027 RepID=A0ABS0IIX1_9BACT|nr:hypothetical protein [Hymenobacter jeongseonensis]MBF9238297.1 hypothetical protein [Hymenobacter jeongseonensis]
MKTSFIRPVAQSFANVKSTTHRALGAAKAGRPVLFGLLGLVALGMASSAHAESNQPVQVTQPDAQSLRVRINNATNKAATLRVIKLDNGSWILNEIHKEPAYGTLLKFNDLPVGRYAVVLHVGPNRYRYEVQVAAPTPGATTIAVRETMTRRVESGLATAAL